LILIPCNIINVDTEVYPSPAEGIGLENRQGSQIPRGFESLYLLHNLLITTAHKLDIDEFRYRYVTEFLFSNILKNHRITGGFSVYTFRSNLVCSIYSAIRFIRGSILASSCIRSYSFIFNRRTGQALN
jgi:hypothetical protein